ncbi:hypothetical protein Asppvi_005409 [Aspergillus pseudoviridinutans]|uniref:Uncharacterized protein n=1 Tax=Aspergillus pseudoviridinutans TaxID=1517512 RepID=A0A9P3BBZ2_9EURO|nr:uncharacterized protein Asppvi_005409 [Aspergillus pseudoviridinutans]GIJ86520.1 hypothetical protein Asppvi_005409 [Aspergillus pseudoviridinutans]
MSQQLALRVEKRKSKYARSPHRDASTIKLTSRLASAMVTYRLAEIVRAKEKIALIDSAMTNELNLLAKRVGHLSQYIREHGLEIPAMSGEDEQNLKNILQALGFDHGEIRSGSHRVNQAENSTDQDNYSVSPPEQDSENRGNVISNSSPDFMSASSKNFSNSREPPTFRTSLGLGPTPDEGQRDAALVDHDSSIPLFANAIQESATHANIPPDLMTSVRDPGNEQQDNAISDDLPSADADDEFTNQLSWRLGRLQLTQDGQLRYFGSTSNLTLLDGLVSVNFSSSNNTQKDTQEVLENANLNVAIDETLEHHLLELYFAWQNPSLYLVDYEVFWKTRQQNENDQDGLVSSYNSRALVDAM